MAPLDVLPHTCLQFLKPPGPRGRGKYRPMDFFRREAAGSPNHYLVAVIVPLQDRPWTDPKLLPDLGGHGDLTLCGEL
jgi:hypothetical protein